MHLGVSASSSKTYRSLLMWVFRLCSKSTKVSSGQRIKLKLRGQPIAVFALLLEHPGELVTREEIRKQCRSSITRPSGDRARTLRNKSSVRFGLARCTPQSPQNPASVAHQWEEFTTIRER